MSILTLKYSASFGITSYRHIVCCRSDHRCKSMDSKILCCCFFSPHWTLSGLKITWCNVVL